jgi:hypothetical protein
MAEPTPLDLAEGRRLLSEATDAALGIWQGAVDDARDADADLIVWLRNNAEAPIAAGPPPGRLERPAPTDG